MPRGWMPHCNDVGGGSAVAASFALPAPQHTKSLQIHPSFAHFCPSWCHDTASSVMFSSVICLLAAIYLFSAISLGQASPTPERHSSTADTSVIRSETCTVDGDSDIYGLGVRVGLYLQWLSGFILRNIGSWDTVGRVRTANNALCAALALATAINIVDGKALAIDYFISYYLTVILFYSESYNLRLEVGEKALQAKATSSKPGNRIRWRREFEDGSDGKLAYFTLAPDLSLISQNLFFTAWTLFGAWYWLSGINLTRESPCAEDAAIVLLFSLHSRKWKIAATLFAIVLSIFWSVVFVVNSRGFISTKGKKPGPIITAVFEYYDVFCGGTSTIKTYKEPEQIGDQFKRPLWKNYFHYIWLYLMGPVVGIISVERIIAGNNLSTSVIKESTGQMISLVTGVTSMLYALWELGIWLNLKMSPERGDAQAPDSAKLKDVATPPLPPATSSTCQPGSLSSASGDSHESAASVAAPIACKFLDQVCKEELLGRKRTNA
ncbi:hypothetical protein B0O99DRAFT_643236 [Bisporella sp. PMI_857]|nr:hypothetical protein B0O99DRAFT_643236 [Bisporella sp. PMI_857]